MSQRSSLGFPTVDLVLRTNKLCIAVKLGLRFLNSPTFSISLSEQVVQVCVLRNERYGLLEFCLGLRQLVEICIRPTQLLVGPRL